MQAGQLSADTICRFKCTK